MEKPFEVEQRKKGEKIRKKRISKRKAAKPVQSAQAHTYCAQLMAGICAPLSIHESCAYYYYYYFQFRLWPKLVALCILLRRAIIAADDADADAEAATTVAIHVDDDGTTEHARSIPIVLSSITSSQQLHDTSQRRWRPWRRPLLGH